MKKGILIFLIIYFPYRASCQIEAGRVFVVGDNFVDDECRVEFFCDYSTLVIFSKEKFLLMNYCNTDVSDMQSGRYSIKGDSMYLIFTKAGHELYENRFGDVPEPVLMSSKRFAIKHCGSKIILKSAHPSFRFGSRDEKGESYIMNKINHDKHYEKARAELMKK